MQVDVLSVMDEVAATLYADSYARAPTILTEARAAVAELIEADREYDEAMRLANIGYASDAEDRAAQQRFRESIAARRAALARVRP